MGLLVEKPWPTSPEIGVKFGFVVKHPLEEMVLSIARFLETVCQFDCHSGSVWTSIDRSLPV